MSEPSVDQDPEGWSVRVRVDLIQAGDRFVFEEQYGGEGQVLTASGGANNLMGTWTLGTDELDFDLEFNGRAWVRLATEDGPRVRVIHLSDVAKCPKGSLLPGHYRDDASCRCDEETGR